MNRRAGPQRVGDRSVEYPSAVVEDVAVLAVVQERLKLGPFVPDGSIFYRLRLVSDQVRRICSPARCQRETIRLLRPATRYPCSSRGLSCAPCHLHERIQCDLLYKQGGVDNLDPETGVGYTGHDCECVLCGYQSYFGIDAVDKYSSLRKRSTWKRPMISTTRLRKILSRQVT